ncbi:methyl-accepting chemotaxis protein [Sphaerotilus hippei]|uniref:Methyl-accepting chemotaxis protein n=1 Tax=Sphaerotilus hippei TaxID=744406 RepID=A0A318HB89_9BURK|nr:methyl-accepting chemotaxis protein [Sphaerotilus hippei]PXW96167.1 methyl-accepting chemotaxis protein [Sphaerotilus hippei]
MQWTIRRKLWIQPAMMAMVLVVVGSATMMRTRTNLAEAEGSQQQQQEKLALASRWSGLTETNAARTSAMLMTGEAQVEAAIKADIKATSAEISGLQERIVALSVTEDERQALATVAQRRKDYLAVRDTLAAGKAAAGADIMQRMNSEFRPALAAYTEAQKAYVHLQETRSAQLRADMGAQRMRTVWAVIGVLAAVVAGLMAGTVLLVRLICVPLADVARAAQRIGEGDLTQDMPAGRADEVGAVLDALSAMQTALRRTVSQVRESAESIQVASSEVATGNQDLSGRTEQTASNLQNAASSMEQLTGTVRQTADSASTANQLASSAAQAARKGGAVVSQVVTNMEEITTSSRRIAEIIGVIDGIAFQTNILALNAAVEAARAGEQGRGFAVVAGEVRNLAQRSANAAREIKSLINASVEKVESGSKLVQDAGVTMNEIVSGVQRVSDIIGEITAAATEQSNELGQVNMAVTQLDQMTQQNAALVEQSAAAAESLKDQAVRLASVVTIFRLQQGRDVFSPPAPAPAPASTGLRSPSPVVATRPPQSRLVPRAPAPAPAPAPAREVATADAGDWETF